MTLWKVKNVGLSLREKSKMLIINIYFYAIKLLNNINLLKRIFNGRYFLRLFKSCNLLLPKHILFIHIPKTNWTSFELYLVNKYNEFLINYSPNKPI